jgi:uncharacterized membrane protein (UPF0127 family)
MLRHAIAIVASIALIASIACGESRDNDSAITVTPVSEVITGGQAQLRTVDVQLDDQKTLTVEVADDPSERTQGLSGRSGLADGTGMLFVWDAPGQHTLWMKDMLFGLDFVWLSEDGTVVSIDRNVAAQPGVPASGLRQYHPGADARYAIELGAGEADDLGINAGDRLRFNAAVD